MGGYSFNTLSGSSVFILFWKDVHIWLRHKQIAPSTGVGQGTLPVQTEVCRTPDRSVARLGLGCSQAAGVLPLHLNSARSVWPSFALRFKSKISSKPRNEYNPNCMLFTYFSRKAQWKHGSHQNGQSMRVSYAESYFVVWHLIYST